MPISIVSAIGSPICVMWSCSAAEAPKSRAGALLPQGPRVAGIDRRNDANLLPRVKMPAGSDSLPHRRMPAWLGLS